MIICESFEWKTIISDERVSAPLSVCSVLSDCFWFCFCLCAFDRMCVCVCPYLRLPYAIARWIETKSGSSMTSRSSYPENRVGIKWFCCENYRFPSKNKTQKTNNLQRWIRKTHLRTLLSWSAVPIKCVSILFNIWEFRNVDLSSTGII